MAETDARLSQPQTDFMASHAHWWLALMLLALHAATAWGIDSLWSRAFLLAHIGLFLLWQPLWRGEGEIATRYVLLVVIAGVLLAALSNWWCIAAWLAALTGLIGGGVPGMSARRQRMVSLLSALYVMSLLLIWVVPQLAGGSDMDIVTTALVRYGLPLIPVAILLMRVETPQQTTTSPLTVDLFYSLMLFLLVTALVLGSYAIMQSSHGPYGLALAQTLMVIALVLLGLSWLWNPRAGFSGIGQLLSRYLMSVGLPFERWVQQLAGLAEREREPQQFLTQALEHMMALPWITGLHWETRAGSGQYGHLSTHHAEYAAGDLRMSIHTRWSLSPAMLLHLRLLAQMVAHFHAAKQREELQRQNAYTQAIYETGSRLTHDVKNMLQSMHALCAAAESSTPEQSQAFQALVQRQLPRITQRLNATLEKLRAPQHADARMIDAADWWAGLQQRHAHRDVQFDCEGEITTRALPAELFDSTADNLIDNAVKKRAVNAATTIRVTFSPASSVLMVVDSGSAIPQPIAAKLFSAPLASQTGLGVGLYHAARQAAQSSYRLNLETNTPGNVRFVLRPAASAVEQREQQNI